MKKTKWFALAIMLTVLLLLAACSTSAPAFDKSEPLLDSPRDVITVSTLDSLKDYISTPIAESQGQVYLYGEEHGVDKILIRELELWHDYYHNKNMRHLFVELPYYTAEFLNIWMQEDNDDILNALYNDWSGTAAYVPSVKEFYKQIKMDCPETVFHGTDIGHQINTGERFLEYLEKNNLKDSDQYLLTQEAIEQGKYYYDHNADAYRENKMAKNFIREYDTLSGESIMGIYGAGHTGLDAMDYVTRSVPSMANQLKERYGAAIHSEDLSRIAKDIKPSRIDTITVNEKEYVASYYGKEDIDWHDDYVSREFWRLENAYDNFKDRPKSGDMLPYNNYPMLIETGQVFVIDLTKKDDSVVRMYYRSDGNDWAGMFATEEFTIK